VSDTLAEIFSRVLDEGRRDEARALPGLERLLAERIAEVHAAWPGLSLTTEQFFAHVAARVPEGWPLERAVGELRLCDLYLACACATLDETALKSFDDAYIPEVRRALSRVQTNAVSIDDAKQMLREKLFVSHAGDPPTITKYSGRGDLRNWVRVVLSHLVIDRAREYERRQEVPIDTADALDIPSELDVELGYLKVRYRSEFQSAFAAAIGSLTSRQRNLLRQQAVFGTSLGEIAAVYSVHRATGVRWLAEAREQLYSSTRRALERSLQLERGEFESLLRLVRSQLEVSLERLLCTPDPTGDGPRHRSAR
jgi:RNA polymerase sigma-70 factor (ECF subfamily)